MKILLTADPELPVPPKLYGGIERIIEALVNEYVKKGHEVTLCANANSKVPCRLIGWKGTRSQNRIDILKNIITLTGLVYKERFDIVHSFSRLAYMTAIFPIETPKIMSYQREPSVGQVQKAVMLSRKGSFAVTGCSNYITNQLSSVCEAHTIYNCASVEHFSFSGSIDSDAPLVFLGRIEDIKGTHIAIDIAQRAYKKLIIAGNIPQGKEHYFEKMIKPHLSDRITYIGPVNDEQKNELLGNALAFLMPIQWNEPFGIVMAEAMACGTPVLGFPFGSVSEVVVDNINGFICSNTDEMVERVNIVNTIDRKSVRKIAEARFSNSKIATDYLELYRKLINRANRENEINKKSKNDNTQTKSRIVSYPSDSYYQRKF